MGLPTIKIENAAGEVLNLSADPRYEPVLSGTGPPSATIMRSKMATSDGTRFNSATVDERNLVLTIYMRRDIARARLALYRWAAAKAYIKVYYENDGIDVWLDGYIETVEVDPWEQLQNVQISIICPQPFWQDLQETYTDASDVKGAFSFPFAIPAAGIPLSTIDQTASSVIVNDGQVSTGLRIEILAKVRSLQPRIYNLETGEFIGFSVDMEPGDRLIVNTTTGQKSIVLSRNGIKTNYINTLMAGSTWLQLSVGRHEFSYTVDEGALEMVIYHTNKYQGV